MDPRQTKLILILAGLIVLVGVSVGGSWLWAYWENLQQEEQRIVSNQHNEHEESTYTDAIERNKSGTPKERMTAEYHYGEWLYKNERPRDAIEHFTKAAALAKQINNRQWESTSLRRQALAQHDLYLRDSSYKVDPKVMEQSLQIYDSYAKGADERRASNLAYLAALYADAGRYSEALRTLESSLDVLKESNSQDLPDAYVQKAQILIQSGNWREAMKVLNDTKPVFNKVSWTCFKELRNIAGRAEFKNVETMQKQAQALFRKQDWPGLEALAASLRKSKKQSPSGHWELQSMYEALQLEDAEPDDKWESTIASLKKWGKDRPESVTAKVALAEVLKDYAWRARGSGYAHTVSDEGNRKMADRLAEAREILGEAKELNERCPVWASATQGVALGEGMDKPEYEAFVSACRKEFPDYPQIIFSQAYFLQPRWYGDEGEWDTVVQDECNYMPGTAGDAVYAQTVWSLQDLYNNVFEEGGADRDRTKRGLDALAKQHPDSPTLSIATLRLSELASRKQRPTSSED